MKRNNWKRKIEHARQSAEVWAGVIALLFTAIAMPLLYFFVLMRLK